jgi:SSS family solute:Na+ symporter
MGCPLLPAALLQASPLRWCQGGVLVYFLVLAAIGLAGRHRVRSAEDYALAGRRFSLGVATLALLASWFGVGSCLGIAGQVCAGGLRDVAADPFAASLSLLLAGLFLAGALRKQEGTTVTDCIAARFGRAAGVYAAIWMIPVYAGWLGSMVVGLGSVVHLLTGLDARAAQWAGAGVILLYTVAGGMWAASMTDVVQMLLIVLGLALVLPGALAQAGGLREVLARNADSLSLLPGPPPEGVTAISHAAHTAGTWMIMGLGCMVGQDLMQRAFACRSPKVAARSTVAAGFLYLAIAGAPILIGLAAKSVLPANGITPDAIGPDFENQVFVRMALLSVERLHPIAVALVFCTILSAIMSSADSALLAASSLAIHGIVLPLCPQLPPRRALAWARATTAGMLLLSVWLARRSGSVYHLMVNSWAAQLVVILIPVLAAVFLPGATRRNAWAAMTVAPAVWMAVVGRAVAKQLSGGMPFSGALSSDAAGFAFTEGAAWGFLAGLAAFVLASPRAACRVSGGSPLPRPGRDPAKSGPLQPP